MDITPTKGIDLKPLYSWFHDNLSKGIRYYQPLDTDGNYWAGGWTQFFSAAIDYFNQGFSAVGNYVGYDRYGRMGLAGRATYNFTPR